MEMTELFGTLITKIITEIPIGVSIILGGIAIAIAIYLNIKKINIEDKTTSSAIQNRQITSLINQIELLSNELEEARDQMNKIHNQNITLMMQLREANQKIGDLEDSWRSLNRTIKRNDNDSN